MCGCIAGATIVEATRPAKPQARVRADREPRGRQELIRHGRYTQAWSFKQAGGPRLVLMPIPQSQLDANPVLVQNPGY